jgi:prephenate dehydrogenase
MKLLIVGSGSMGRWFASAVDADITYLDIEPEMANEAAGEMGCGIANPDTEELFDVVCIAVPMPFVEEAITKYSKNASGGLCDITGSMATPIKNMKLHADGIERLSMHPLFGPLNCPGRIAIVEDNMGPLMKKICDDLEKSGNTLFNTTVDEHDEAMKTVQGMAHAAILSFGLAAEKIPDKFGTPIFDGLMKLTMEITRGNPRVYSDIQKIFGGSIEISNAARRISDSDEEEFKKIHEDLK